VMQSPNGVQHVGDCGAFQHHSSTTSKGWP